MNDVPGGHLATLARDPLLDGLRGGAVLAVVYVHYVFYSGLSHRPGGGHAGVLVFFVLSGYLITRQLWKGSPRPAKARYGSFLRRRIVRLYPALLGVVIVGGPATAILGPGDADLAGYSAVVVLLQLTAFVHIAGESPLEPWLPTWSLTVEWVFYLLWPVIVMTLQGRGASAELARRITLAIAGGLFLMSLTLSAPQFYFLPVGNLSAMLVGAALYFAHSQRGSGRYPGRDRGVSDLAFAMLLIMVLLPSNVAGHDLYRLTYFPAAVLAAFFIIDQRPGTGGLANSLLGSRVMSGLGRASYSIYLWHLPILWIVWWGLPSISAVNRALISLAGLAVVTYLSYTLLEKPWLPRVQTGGRTPALHDRPLPVKGRTVDVERSVKTE